MKDNWKKYSIDLDEVKEKSKTDFSYFYIGDKKIEKIRPACSGCTEIMGWDKKELKIRYTAPVFPRHLGIKKHYMTKVISIVYDDGDVEDLIFNIELVKK